MRQTTYPKGEIKNRKWHLVDIKDCVLGRVASRVASILNGKNNVNYTTYSNNADGVIVINAKHIALSGDKLQKPFYWHTGFPGGIKQRTIEERLNSHDPCHVFRKAVERMLPRGPLGRAKMKNLRIYADESHAHHGLQPLVWDLKSEHVMNQRR